MIQVNGLYRHGFLISPVVVEQINQLIANFKKSGGSFANISNDQKEFSYSSWLPITFVKGDAPVKHKKVPELHSIKEEHCS